MGRVDRREEVGGVMESLFDARHQAQAWAAVAAALIKNRGLTEAQAIAEVRRLARG
jgi:hypothetical protein